MTVVKEKRLTQRLADQFRYRTMMGQRDYRVEEEERLGKVSHIRRTLKLDIERARFVTQAYKENDGDPIVIRRAKAMANHLDNMTLYIYEHDRIVGNTAITPDHTISYPELYCRWVDKAIDMGYREMLSDEHRAEMHEINKYWMNKSIHGTERFLVQEEDKPYWSYMNHGAFIWVHGAHSGQMPNYEKLFRVGLNGILKEAHDKLNEVKTDRELLRDHPKKFLKKKAFLEAVIISVEAAIRWAKRYAELARAMANAEEDENRRKELEQIAEEYERAVVQGASLRSRELSFVRKDGKQIYLDMRSHAVRDKEGKVIAYEGILRDITERKRMEEEVHLLSDAVKMTTDSVAITDMSGMILDINEAGLRLYGLSDRADFVGRNPLDAIAPEDRRKAIENMAKIMETGQVEGIEYHIVRKDGSRILIETSVSLIKDYEGKPKGLVAVARDITERKSMEEALRESKEKLRLVFESITDGIVVTDLNGVIIDANERAVSMGAFGSKEAILGKSSFELIASRDHERAAMNMQKTLEDKLVTSLEYILIRADGSEYPGEMSARVLNDASGNPVGFVGVVRDITERKRAEEALRYSEEYFRALTENMSDAIVVLDADGILRYESPSVESVLGYKAGERAGMNGLDFIHPDDVQNAAEDLAKLIQHPGSSIRKELRAKHNDGSWRAAEITAANLLDNPAVGGIVINFRDITERKKAEDKIRLGELHLRELLGLHRMTASTEKEILNFTLEASVRSLQSPFAFIGIMSADEAAMTIHAWSKGAMEQCAVTEKPIHFPIAEAGLWGEVVRQRRPIIVNDYDTSIEFKKGYPKSHVPIKRFLCIPVFSASRIVAVAAVANKVSEYDETDISALISLIHEMWNLVERKQGEEALRLSEERYRLLVDNASEAIVVIQDGMFKFFNDRAVELLGYSREELASKPFIELIHPDDQQMLMERYLERLKGGNPPSLYSFKVINKAGNVLWGEVNAVAITWEGRPATLNFLTDVTERKKAEEEKQRMEEQLRLAGRLAAVGELSAGVAHELNNPIAAIQGFAQLLTGRNDLDETTKKDLGIIYREAQRAAKITQNLLSFARRHEPEKGFVSLNEVLEKTIELRAHQMKVNNIEVVVEFATDLPKTTADFFQMQQVFVNIINNAEQAMVEAHRKGRLVVKTQKAGNMIQATFADDGPGISEDNLKRIFDPFFTTKEVGKGTGLGLSICYGIVEAHGGRIYARSKLGQGATVVVEIPIVAEGQ